MGTIAIPLHAVLAGLSASFRSADLRVAMNRGRGPEPSGDEWRPLKSVIRIAPRSMAVVRTRQSKLRRTFGSTKTSHFAISSSVLAFTDLPRLLPTHGFRVRIVRGQPVVEAVPLEQSTLAGRISRHGEWGRPTRHGEWPAIEYAYVSDRSVLPLSGIDTAFLDTEIRRTLGIPTCEALIRANLEILDAPARVSDVFVEVEMPAAVSSVRLVGETLLHVEVKAERQLGPVRLFASHRGPDGISLYAHKAIPLRRIRRQGMFDVLQGQTKIGNSAPEDHISCVLTHGRVPELDEKTSRVRELIPIVERNPLLVCLRRFWDLQELSRRLEVPFETRSQRRNLTPQLAFQAAVAHVLTLAGFQTIDLGADDKMRHPETQVEIATADTLAYHGPSKILLVAACTINVPRSEDYQRVLHAASILGMEFPKGTRVVLLPALFTGQEPESAVLEQVAAQRLRLFTRQDLGRLMALVESGEEQRLILVLSAPGFAL